MKRNVYIDLNQSKLFGVSTKCIEMLKDLKSRGYQVKIIAKDWSKSYKYTGLTFDKETKSFQKGTSLYLWDPKTHPNDFYLNLICSSFENIEYIVPRKNKFKCINIIKRILNEFNPLYFSEIHFISIYANQFELKQYIQQHFDMMLKKISIKSILIYLFSLFSIKFILKTKLYPRSRGLRYKLNPEMHTTKVQDFIKAAKKENNKYILISANWDDELSIEPREHLRRGINYEPIEFNSMVRYVKDLDKYAQEGKIKFVLASKKAVDWSKIIKSSYLDLRNFEENDFTLSQTIYILQEITSMTINWATTFSTWMTNIEGPLHLTWGDKKDSARWTWNNLNNEPVEKALKLINVI